MSAAKVQRKATEAYRQSLDEVLAAHTTDSGLGLSQAEAQARREKFGRNELTAEKPVPVWRKFLEQFQDVLVILLLIATLISAVLWLYERDSALPYEAIAIFAVVLLNAIMGFIQGSRAEQALAALRQLSAAHATVIRDGARQNIPAAELVPGDIILIEEGDTIPADARVLQSTALANSGSRIDRREPASRKRCKADCGRRGTRRPPEHDLQRHGSHLRARKSSGYGYRDADSDGTDRRNA